MAAGYQMCEDGGELALGFMRQFGLRAVNTFFQPERKGPKVNGVSLGNATYLPKTLEQLPTQIDYILVSNTWVPCVLDNKVRWGPTIHRHTRNFDHAMVTMTWKDRLRKVKEKPKHLRITPVAEKFDKVLQQRVDNRINVRDSLESKYIRNNGEGRE